MQPSTSPRTRVWASALVLALVARAVHALRRLDYADISANVSADTLCSPYFQTFATQLPLDCECSLKIKPYCSAPGTHYVQWVVRDSVAMFTTYSNFDTTCSGPAYSNETYPLNVCLPSNSTDACDIGCVFSFFTTPLSPAAQKNQCNARAPKQDDDPTYSCGSDGKRSCSCLSGTMYTN